MNRFRPWRWLVGKGADLVRPVSGYAAPFETVRKQFVRAYPKGLITRLRLPGTSGNRAATSDNAALDITGDIDIRVAVSLPDWTPGANKDLSVKFGAAGQRSWAFLVGSGNVLTLTTTANGSTSVNNVSLTSIGGTDGQILLVRVAYDVNDGGGNRVATFYKKATTPETAYADATVHTGWTTIDAITTAGATTIFNSTANLETGSFASGSRWTTGYFYAHAVYSGIEGTLAYGVDFTEGPVAATVLTDKANSLTVTIAQSGANAATIEEEVSNP